MKNIFIVICLVLFACCGETVTKDDKSKNNVSNKVRPQTVDSVNLSLSNNENLVNIADKIKKYLSQNTSGNFPTKNVVKEVNLILNSNILLVDTTNYFLYFRVNNSTNINFQYLGRTNGMYLFNTFRSILIINATTKEKYVFVFSPETLYGKSKLQAVFSVNSQLMPIFSVKRDLHNNQFGIEKYPYLDKYGMDFMALSYKTKTSDFDKLTLLDLPVLFDGNLQKTKPDTVFFRNGRMFLNIPLWDDSGGFYLFQ